MPRKAIALLAGALAALLLAETLLHLLDVPPTRPFFQEFTAPDRSFKLMCYDSNPSGALDVDLRDPGRRGRYPERFPDREFDLHWMDTPWAVEVSYNSQGFRERELTAPAPGVLRIVVVGDSFTYGHGLPERLCYPRQLETILRTRPGRAVEVLNCGSGGDDLDRIGPRAARLLEELRPDVLVYGYFLNDPIRDPGPEGVHAMLDVGWLRAESSGCRFSLGAWPRAGVRTFQLVGFLAEKARVTRSTLDWYRALHEPRSWSRTADALVDLDRRCRGQGCRFLLAVLPIIWRLDGAYPLGGVHDGIASRARAHGLEVLDGLDALRGRRDAELFLHPRDRHPNATYARLVAEALARVIP